MNTFMSESPPTPGSDRKRKHPDAPTSISTRVWVAESELVEFRKLLSRYGDAVLTDGARQLVQEKGEGGVDAYPGWLALGLAIRMARESIEARLSPPEPALVQNAKPAPKPKRGSR